MKTTTLTIRIKRLNKKNKKGEGYSVFSFFVFAEKAFSKLLSDIDQ